MFMTGVLCTVCGAQVYLDFVAAGGIVFHKHILIFGFFIYGLCQDEKIYTFYMRL